MEITSLYRKGNTSLDTKSKQIVSELQHTSGGHIVYFSQNQESYIETAVSFILSGVKEGNHIILIENDRDYKLIYEKISGTLTPSELEKVLHVNNFDFYWSTGNFDTPNIVAMFFDILEPYLKNSIPVRTWAHVEWGQLQDASETISKFEEAAQESVTMMKLLSVCAYDDDKLTAKLKELLLKYHTHLLTDHDLTQL